MDKPSLYFVTSNEWKYRQAHDYFQRHQIELAHFAMRLPESRSEDVIVIAREKAVFAYRQLNHALFVMDGALYFKALNDFPKTYVKFVETHLGAEGILKLLRDVNERRWSFANVLYYIDGREEKHFVGLIQGTVSETIAPAKPEMVRAFERIQIPDGYEKTFAQMSTTEIKQFDKTVWKPTVFDPFIRWWRQKYASV